MNDMRKDFFDLVFYQIYPRSFYDSNNDGTGDLAGITEKIPYLAELGINAVWLSPFYKSPNDDGGYDISDFRAVNEEFGTLEDFRRMTDTFHRYGMKVIVDFVPNHTSTSHRWFREARKSKDNPYHDYYIWADEPINDWRSGSVSSWQYDECAKQYYLHSFNVSQADLNWENPKVREEMRNVIDYWIDLGADGFRCDVIDMISKDIPNGKMNKGPHLHEYINEIFGREKTRNIFTVGECWGANINNIKALTGEDRGELTTVFQFEHVNRNCTSRFSPRDFTLSEFHDVFSKWQKITEENDLLYTLFIENHDLCRSVSRFADDNELRYESATMFAVMIYCMRGIPFIYQGQEIGVTNSHFDSIKDFDDWETIDFYNANKDKMTHDKLMERVNFGSRDNARHPMPWNSTKNGGFNKGGKTWLPLYPSYKEINVEKDISSEKSILRFYKELLQIRRSSEILRYGTFEDITGEAKEYFMYRRAYNGKSILVVCNYEKRSSIPLPENIRRVLGNYPLHADNVFSPYEAAIYAEE